MTTDRKLSRRHTLGLGLGIIAAPAILRGPAHAEGGRVVVGTWGGDYARLLTKNIEDPILKPKGYEVAQDQASDGPRRTKMVAEKRLPRGTTDIQGLSAANMYEMNEAGVVETIDYSKLKNAASLMPSMKYPYGVGHIYSGKVVVYNPKLIPDAPKSFKDAFDPKHGNKMGIIDIQYQWVMAAAAMAAKGGKVADYEGGKPLLMEAKKAGVRIYPTNEAFAQALKNEEIGIGIMWKARVVQWQNAGINVQSVAPTEGLPMYVSGFSIPKNAPNKDGAYAYMDAMLEKSAQENFAVDMGYNPTVTNATVAPDLQERIGFTPEEQKRLVDLDYGYIAQNDSALKEWWDKAFKA
ncbi:MAG: extracellular solute-binding protein [Alphaproteobacteria bacterium]|nr:MAG: extracellular solute-binding protein [Alphaproteobacteria bacterium]